MKKILLIACLFAFGSFSFAQQKSSTNATSINSEKKNNFDEWSSALNLTESQKQQIKGIQEKYKEEKVTMRKNGVAQDFKKLNDKQQAEINAVLTPEQIKKNADYKAIKIKEKEEKASIKSAVK